MIHNLLSRAMKCSYRHSLFEMYALFFPFFLYQGKKLKLKFQISFIVDNTPTPQALPLLAQDVIIVVVFGLFQNPQELQIIPTILQHQGKVLNNNFFLVSYVRQQKNEFFWQLDIILNDEAIGLENFNSNFWHGKHIFFKNFGNSKK